MCPNKEVRSPTINAYKSIIPDFPVIPLHHLIVTSVKSGLVSYFLHRFDALAYTQKVCNSRVHLSQIRSSEDVSSGYSSAEPLYSGHHPTRSEGLATSREPLVRTASVGGASRTARTRTTRGGAVPKRSSPAEVPGFATLPRSKKPSKKKIQ
ncbi:Protein of unknown function [Gryllus bimaculatus]|nr:Protein of unknown function [Gryllus bimaculatus]